MQVLSSWGSPQLLLVASISARQFLLQAFGVMTYPLLPASVNILHSILSQALAALWNVFQ